MLAKTPIQTLFYKYVASRDPDEGYYWANYQTCACGQFMREEGIEADRETYRAIWGHYPDESMMPNYCLGSLNALAYGDGTYTDWTFGALRQRLEAAGYGE